MQTAPTEQFKCGKVIAILPVKPPNPRVPHELLAILIHDFVQLKSQFRLPSEALIKIKISLFFCLPGRCSMCSEKVRFDVIGRLETFSDDLRYIVIKKNLSHLIPLEKVTMKLNPNPRCVRMFNTK
jgi:hypothetical protein